MLDFINNTDFGWFAVAMVYLGGIATASIVRSFGVAGGTFLVSGTRLASGWLQYRRNDARNTVNAMLVTTQGGKLSVDTVVSNYLSADVWPNVYHLRKLWRAAKKCSTFSTIIQFDNLHDYKATYAPLINLIAERCTSVGSIDFAIGRPMVEYVFVVALTFEPAYDGRPRRFRAMVVLEDELIALGLAKHVIPFDCGEHANRALVLMEFAEKYAKDPTRFGRLSVWRPKTSSPDVPCFSQPWVKDPYAP